LKQNIEPLSFTRSMWVIICVSLWIMTATVFLLYMPSGSTISPALWLHVSATLVMFLLIIRLGGHMKGVLFLHTVKSFWLLLAIVTGIIYWYFDHFLIGALFSTDNSESIKSWQLANANYHFFSVFITSAIMAPVFEELFFRGLIFRSFLERFNLFFATAVSALLFALIHWSWPEFLSLFLVGIIYAVLAFSSKSVITPIIAHSVHNLITYCYFIQ